MAGTVKLSGEVKTVNIARKEKDDTIKLVVRIVLEFEPTEKGLSEVQDLLSMQELPVNVTITGQQIDLPMAKAK